MSSQGILKCLQNEQMNGKSISKTLTNVMVIFPRTCQHVIGEHSLLLQNRNY